MVTDVARCGTTTGSSVEVGLSWPLELSCPELGESMTGNNHRRRRWRHLDTCQYKTIIEADIPRGECLTYGVRQVDVPRAEERSRFTALLETLAIDWLRESRSASGTANVGGDTPDHGACCATGTADDEVRSRFRFWRRREVLPEAHEDVTVVNDLENWRVLRVADGRGKASRDSIWATLTEEQLDTIQGHRHGHVGSVHRFDDEHLPDASNKVVASRWQNRTLLLSAPQKT